MKKIIFIVALLFLNGCIDTEKKDKESTQTENTNTNTNNSSSSLNTPTYIENSKPQYVSYISQNGEAKIVEAKTFGSVSNISQHLAKTNTGEEKWINISPNGVWLLLDSTRLDERCEGWGCLIYGKRDLSEFKTIEIQGEVVHSEGFSAISNAGDLIVVHLSKGDRNDLFVSKKVDNEWNKLIPITSNSPSDNNQNPALSADGKEVVFDCGNNICMVNSDGTDIKTLIELTDKGEKPWTDIGNADFDLDGNIVFRGTFVATWLWRYDRKKSTFTLINNTNNNDNFPCVLSNGEIASLWYGRAENEGGSSELKIMNPSGNSQVIAVTYDKEIFDSALGCGGL